jgi:protein-S-isoprenylcysteine O-methyltransferase Ste14
MSRILCVDSRRINLTSRGSAREAQVRKSSAAGGTALFFAAAPGVVAGAVPWALTGWRLAGDLPAWLRVVGGAVTFVAAVLLVHSFARFVIEGSGTPAPPAPTERLVVGGLYRYVRNPMYLAVLGAVLGQALLLGQAVLVAYAVVLLAAVVSFVRWYEEPTLSERFGPAYDDHRASVPGWIPRLSRRPTPLGHGHGSR